LLARAEDPGRLFLEMSPFDLQCRAFETFEEMRAAETLRIGAEIIPDASSRFAQWLVEQLIARGSTEAVSKAFEDLLRSPRRNPETFIWAARQFFGGKYAALTPELPPVHVLREMVDFMKESQNQVDHGVPNASTLRGQIIKFRNLLAEDHFGILRHAILPLEADEAREAVRLFESHAAFPDHYVMSLLTAAREARPDLDEAERAKAADRLDDSVLFVTAESLAARRRELQRLRSVEIPKNSRDIGEAAAHGDLSENAEYEAARHRQRILFDRAGELQRDIERAQPIRPGWVRTDCVWPGTRFQARNERTDEVVTYTILGAWDGRPEDNVLSYLTPAASQFLYKQVGDRVVVERPDSEPTEYEILEIENALA
jgi:transcription elongation GreA/GreB family factor